MSSITRFFVVLAAKKWFVISTDSIVASVTVSVLSLGALHYDGEILATKNDDKIKYIV